MIKTSFQFNFSEALDFDDQGLFVRK